MTGPNLVAEETRLPSPIRVGEFSRGPHTFELVVSSHITVSIELIFFKRQISIFIAIGHNRLQSRIIVVKKPSQTLLLVGLDHQHLPL